jgi:hypothetical protein
VFEWNEALLERRSSQGVEASVRGVLWLAERKYSSLILNLKRVVEDQ